ncbi:MAG TPA: DUF2304 domain-containing protein [Clostridiales bacterium]|nr:DUF2304 domain-containing protein [Clostridiales bacterium]
MSIRLEFSLLIGIFFFLAIIISLLKKKKLNLKYTLVWLLAVVGMLFAALCPSLIGKIANFIGIVTPINFVFMLEGVFVLFIILSLTVIVSHQNERIYRLVQTLAILEKRVRELEKKDIIENEESE